MRHLWIAALLETVLVTAAPAQEVYRGSDGVEHRGESRFDLEVDGGNRPVIFGKTDAPDGTTLFISVTGPEWPDADDLRAAGLPACRPTCTIYSPAGQAAPVLVHVSKGKFATGALVGFGNSPLATGIYEISILESTHPGTPSTDQEIKAAVAEMSKPQYESKIAITANGESFQIPFGCTPTMGLTNGCKR